MTTVNLSGVRTLVTGATNGLGLAMAEALLQAGASVVLAARSASKIRNQVERLYLGRLHL